MSAFEFVLVSFAIVVGFGISEIFAGWGQQIRARHRLPAMPLQIAASALILFFQLRYLWGLWQTRGVEWTFPLYLLVAAPAFVLAPCAHVVRVDTGESALPVREQYFQNTRPVFALLALVPVLVGIIGLAGARMAEPGDTLGIASTTALNFLFFGLMVSLAFSKSERYHWLTLSLIWVVVLAVGTQITFRLPEATS